MFYRTIFLLVLTGMPSRTPAIAQAEASFTAQALFDMSPKEIGDFAGVANKSWVAKTFYPAVPLGGGVGSIVLFAAPEPAASNVCQVESLSVEFVSAAGAAVDDQKRYRFSEYHTKTAFVVADGHADVADVDACRRTAIRPDFMKRSGADNVFEAASAKLAVRGAKAFAKVIDAVADKAHKLPFSLDCKGPDRGLCNSPRNFLSTLDRRDFVSVGYCPVAAGECFRIDGFDGQLDWTLEIAVTGARVTRVGSVKITAVLEPKI